VVENGVAYLQAERTAVIENGKSYSYSAPMITMRNMPIGPYADIELVARLQRGDGISPAFWMMPASGKRFAELDFFESQQWPGKNPDRFNMGPIFGHGRQQWIYNAIDDVDPYALNTYRVEWHPDWTVIKVNGREIARWRTKLHEPGYIILNIAVGGLTAAPPATSSFPVRMELRSLKVWAYP
jgi:beta-glucanase (GH16 family)